MNRRLFLIDSCGATLALGLPARLLQTTAKKKQSSDAEGPGSTSQAISEPVLPGTTPLTLQGDLAAQMVDGIHAISPAPDSRCSSRARATVAAGLSVGRGLQSLRLAQPRTLSPDHRSGGLKDWSPGSRTHGTTMVTSAQVAQGSGYKVYAVSWPVFDRVVADFDGLDAEGLLLQPEGKPVARVVAIPDADWTPEMLVGLAPGVPPAAQFARRLAENGCQVMIPAPHQSQRYIRRNSGNRDDERAPPGMDLSDGLRGRPAHYRVRGAKGARGD